MFGYIALVLYRSSSIEQRCRPASGFVEEPETNWAMCIYKHNNWMSVKVFFFCKASLRFALENCVRKTFRTCGDSNHSFFMYSLLTAWIPSPIRPVLPQCFEGNWGETRVIFYIDLNCKSTFRHNKTLFKKY